MHKKFITRDQQVLDKEQFFIIMTLSLNYLYVTKRWVYIY